MPESNSIDFYNDPSRAESYHRRKGFASERTARMHEVMLALLTALTPAQSTLLELGAGTGLLTQKLLGTQHFREIYATDGAPAMLQVARHTLEAGQTRLHFRELDFTSEWTPPFSQMSFDAVTSSIAIHHAEDKPLLFRRICGVLKPQGIFLLADHIAGSTPWIESLLVRERALTRLGKENQADVERLQEIMDGDAERGRKEGNRCECVAFYEQSLKESGFVDVECIWRDYWLAVFVARKPA